MSLLAFEQQLEQFQEEVFSHSAIPDGLYYIAMQRLAFYHKITKHPNADDLRLNSRALRAANRNMYRRFYAERELIREAIARTST